MLNSGDPMSAESSPAESRASRSRWLWVALLVLCVLGLGVASKLALVHLHAHLDPSAKSFCAISDRINCDTVARSQYSVFLHVPIAAWGDVWLPGDGGGRHLGSTSPAGAAQRGRVCAAGRHQRGGERGAGSHLRALHPGPLHPLSRDLRHQPGPPGQCRGSGATVGFPHELLGSRALRARALGQHGRGGGAARAGRDRDGHRLSALLGAVGPGPDQEPDRGPRPPRRAPTVVRGRSEPA